MPDVSIIVVNWNTRDLLDRCLVSIRSQTGSFQYEVFVVDNGSTDKSASMVKEKYPEVKLIANTKNLGFAKANNQAIKLSQGRYVLLLNSDTQLFKDTLPNLVEFMDNHQEAGAVGAKLLNPDYTLQHSIHNFPNLTSAFFSLFLPLYLLGFIRMSYIKYWDKHDKTKTVDYVSGACLMVREETIKKVGVLDEDFFMYAEEADWCFRIKKAGQKVYFFPEAKLIHYGGGSSLQRGMATRSQELVVSGIKFYKKHHGLFKTNIYITLLVSISILRIIIWQGLYFIFWGRLKKSIYERLFLHRQTVGAIFKEII